MKILVLSGWYPGQLEPLNGDFVKNQVELLRQQGLHMDLVYVDLNIAYVKHQKWTHSLKVFVDPQANKDYILTGPFWPKNTSWGLNSWVKAYVKQIKRYIQNEGKPSLIHAHTYLGGMVALELNKSEEIPYVVTTHFTGWLDKGIKGFHARMGIRGLKGAHRITAVSKSLAKVISEKTERQVDVVQNFIDTALFTSSSNKSDKKILLGDFKALSIGDLIPRKQVDHTIRAVALINNRNSYKLHLEIVGHGPQLLQLKALVATLGQTSFITFVGRLEKEEVADKLKKAHLLLHTSSIETFGLVIAEALCCGVLVVSYNNLGVVEMRDLPGLHICSNQNVENLASKTEEVLQGDQEFGREIRSYQARQALGVASIYKQLATIYEDLLV